MYTYVGCKAKWFSFIILRSQLFIHMHLLSMVQIKNVMHMYQTLYKGLARSCHKLCDTIYLVQISNTKFTRMF